MRYFLVTGTLKHVFDTQPRSSIAGGISRTDDHAQAKSITSPVSVNYYFTSKCNYSWQFCFHTNTDSHKAGLDDANRDLRLLSDAGMKRINFAGGEPFLYADFLGALIEYCKSQLHLESLSVVSNGSLIKKKWLQKYAPYLNILTISCDSFDEKTNIEIGRGSGHQVEKMEQVAAWCTQYKVMFKMNTVVNKLKFKEDMNARFERLAPFRWKVFQVLLVAGE